MSHRKPPQRESMKRKAITGQCRWCDQPITKGGKTWHPACAKEFKLIHWPAETRKAVWKRDRGICRRCGRDLAAEAHAQYSRNMTVDQLRDSLPSWAPKWQHDHIRPLIEANGDISFWLLDNVQVLCHQCHIAKGKEDNARRKAAKAKQEPQLAL